MVGWACILLSGISAICCSPDRKDEIILVMRMVLYAAWFTFDFSFMCARFQWLLNSEDAKFETMSIKTENKQFIWVGPKFYDSSLAQRVLAGCNFTNALLESAPKDACKVWFLPFNADIKFNEDEFMSNTAKFSVGFGLFFFAIIKLVVLFIVEMMMAAPDDNAQQQQQPMPSPRIPSAPPHLITTNGMTAETHIDLAPANVNVSIVYSGESGDIEMTAGQPNASIVWGTAFDNGQQQQAQEQQQLEAGAGVGHTLPSFKIAPTAQEVVPHQVSAVGGCAAGDGARGNAPFLGTDTPLLLPPAEHAVARADRERAKGNSQSSTPDDNFCQKLFFIRMKKAVTKARNSRVLFTYLCTINGHRTDVRHCRRSCLCFW
jgi:hypothetical protein